MKSRIFIRGFASYLMENSKKWNDKKFVQKQYDNHVVECLDLKNACNPHLQAELLDKAIIFVVMSKLNMDCIGNDIIEFEKSVEHGINEFETLSKLLLARKEKFLSKLNLNGG